MVLRILSILFIFFLAHRASAQYYEITDEELDSIYVSNALDKLENSNESEQFVYETEKFKYIAEKIKYHKAVKQATNMLLEHYRTHDNGDAELRVLLQFLNYTRVNKLKKDELNTDGNIGDIYLRYRLFEKASESYNDAIQVAIDLKDQASLYTLLKKRGISYKELENWELAKKDLNAYVTKADNEGKVKDAVWGLQKLSEIAKANNDYSTMVSLNEKILEKTKNASLEKERIYALNNLGVAYKYVGRYSDATNDFKAILNQNTSDVVKAAANQNLGVIAQNADNFESSLKYFKEAVALYKITKAYEDEAFCLDFIALVYYQKGDFYNALTYNKDCIQKAKSYKLPKVEEAAYYTRSLIHQGLYEFEEALEFYKSYLEVKDSLEMVDFKQQQSVLQQQYFLERQESELELHYISEEIKNMEIAKLKAEAQALIDRANAEADRLIAYQADSLLKQEQIVTQMLRIREIENMLKLKEEQERVRARENEILLLDEQKKKKELELDNERLQREAEQEEAARKLEKEAEFNRNLTYILLGLLLLLLIIVFAYRQVRKKKQQIAAQNVIIEEERSKSDKLLLNILPVQVAEELKEKGHTKPRFYEEASVVFTDFAGFTMISEKLTPEELVQTLDKIFLEFDLIIENYGLSRIKTIGDAYMCVSGIPEKDPEHAENAVKAAIEMRNYVVSFNDKLGKNDPKWNIRIGVNSGPLVAGVVGIKKFAYDIWGDAVNIASRMESSGEVSKVNISDTTYAHIKGKFATEHRGKVYAKNKGDIDMYFVEYL